MRLELKHWAGESLPQGGRAECVLRCAHNSRGGPPLSMSARNLPATNQPNVLHAPMRSMQWWVVGGTALLLAAGEAAWSWVRYRREVQQEAERAAARLARMRARARYAACCAAAAERVWPDAAPAALPPPLPPLVPLPVERGPAVAPAPRAAAAVGKGAGGVDDELKAALLAEQWEP